MTTFANYSLRENFKPPLCFVFAQLQIASEGGIIPNWSWLFLLEVLSLSPLETSDSP